MPNRKLCHILDANHCKCLMVMIQDWLENPDVDQIDSGAGFYIWDTRLLCRQTIISTIQCIINVFVLAFCIKLQVLE